MVEQDGVLQEITDLDRIKALSTYSHFRWYVRQLQTKRDSLTQMLSLGLRLSRDQMRLIQLEIKVIDFFLIDPFSILDHANFMKELKEIDEEDKVENR